MKLLAILVALLTMNSTSPTAEPNVVTTYGTFTAIGTEGAQFKSYDNEVWWYLEFSDIGEVPELNKPYAIAFDTNGTNDCEDVDCDCCWREDDTVKKIEKIF